MTLPVEIDSTHFKFTVKNEKEVMHMHTSSPIQGLTKSILNNNTLYS